MVAKRVQKGIDHFVEFGEDGVGTYDFIAGDPATGGMNSLSQKDYVTDSAIPVFAACMMSFSPEIVGDIIKRCGINICELGEHFELNTPGVVYRANNVNDLDVVEFTKRLFRGVAVAYGNDEPFVNTMALQMTENMAFSLAIMDLGIPGINPITMLEDDLNLLRVYPEPGYIESGLSGVGENLSKILNYISKPEHLPNSSPADFLIQSGALHPAIVRKSFGRGFWEAVMFGDMSAHTLAFGSLLHELITQHPHEAVIVLKSLDFDSQEHKISTGLAPWAIDLVEQLLEEKGLGSVTLDISYKLGFLTSKLPSDKSLALDSEERLVREALADERLIGFFKELQDAGPSLFSEVMESHMGLEPVNVSLSHFDVWAFISRLKPGPQNVQPEKLSKYLAHMAQAATTLFPEGHQKIELYGPFIIDQVKAEITEMLDHVGMEIDYSNLRHLDEDSKAILAQWGLCLRGLGVKRSRTIDLRIGADLGL